MAIQLTANHLAQGGAQGAYEPQRANNGVLIVDSLTEWNANQPVMLALESFPIPKESNAQIEARYMNERRKFAGPVNVDDMEVQIKDMVDKPIAHWLLEWRRRVYNPETQDAFGFSQQPTEKGAVGLAKNYKSTGKIFLIAPDGTFKREWNLSGLWPMQMDPGDIDMTSEDFIRITMTLSIDRISGAALTPATPG